MMPFMEVPELAKHSVSVAGIMTDGQGRALLIRRRDNGHWEPPGGVLELNETIEDGLRREVFEETGLNVEPDALTGIYKNMSRGVVALVFRCRIVAGALTTGPETSDFLWATADETRAITAAVHAVRVLDAMSSSPYPAVRSHDGVRIL